MEKWEGEFQPFYEVLLYWMKEERLKSPLLRGAKFIYKLNESRGGGIVEFLFLSRSLSLFPDNYDPILYIEFGRFELVWECAIVS